MMVKEWIKVIRLLVRISLTHWVKYRRECVCLKQYLLRWPIILNKLIGSPSKVFYCQSLKRNIVSQSQSRKPLVTTDRMAMNWNWGLNSFVSQSDYNGREGRCAISLKATCNWNYLICPFSTQQSSKMLPHLFKLQAICPAWGQDQVLG